MSDTWDGRPESPEREGWHWLRSPRDFVRPCLWNPNSKTWLERGSVADMRNAGWRYLGPCLTPSKIAAREQQAREAEQRAETLLAAMDYAVMQGLEAAQWLKAWMEGDEEAKADLDAHRAALEAAR